MSEEITPEQLTKDLGIADAIEPLADLLRNQPALRYEVIRLAMALGAAGLARYRADAERLAAADDALTLKMRNWIWR